MGANATTPHFGCNKCFFGLPALIVIFKSRLMAWAWTYRCILRTYPNSPPFPSDQNLWQRQTMHPLTHFPFSLSKPVTKKNNAFSPTFLSLCQNPWQRQTMHPQPLPHLLLERPKKKYEPSWLGAYYRWAVPWKL